MSHDEREKYGLYLRVCDGEMPLMRKGERSQAYDYNDAIHKKRAEQIAPSITLDMKQRSLSNQNILRVLL